MVVSVNWGSIDLINLFLMISEDEFDVEEYFLLRLFKVKRKMKIIVIMVILFLVFVIVVGIIVYFLKKKVER